LSQVESFRNSGRIELSGPPIAVSADAVQYLAMAFHELSTNALKHGAFSVETGRVYVTWTISEDLPAEFKIIWQERGGPAPKSKSKSGFGKLVLERLMPAAVEGAAEIVVEPDGITWTLSAPLHRVLRN
jgi:two-component sensor histidine kinase